MRKKITIEVVKQESQNSKPSLWVTKNRRVGLGHKLTHIFFRGRWDLLATSGPQPPAGPTEACPSLRSNQ